MLNETIRSILFTTSLLNELDNNVEMKDRNNKLFELVSSLLEYSTCREFSRAKMHTTAPSFH